MFKQKAAKQGIIEGSKPLIKAQQEYYDKYIKP